MKLRQTRHRRQRVEGGGIVGEVGVEVVGGAAQAAVGFAAGGGADGEQARDLAAYVGAVRQQRLQEPQPCLVVEKWVGVEVDVVGVESLDRGGKGAVERVKLRPKAGGVGGRGGGGRQVEQAVGGGGEVAERGLG